jgi:hypothetical protein
MESIRNSMDPRAKEKHEDSKKEEKPEQPVIISQDYQLDMNSLKEIKQRN